MMKKNVDQFINFFFKLNNKSWLVSLIILSIIISPLLISDFIQYKLAEKHLTELTLSRRKSVAHLATILLKEKFDHIIDLGTSLATRVQFRKLIETGKWDDAIKILASVPKDFLYIDKVLLFDPKGTIMAVTPDVPEVIGQNFAYRDYYKGVSKNWQPYVSDVFKRAVKPQYNVVSVAIPIKSDDIKESDRKILGILLLTIKLDTILDWSNEIDPGNGGFTYFVDRNGNVAGHPKFSSRDNIVNFGEVPVVKKVLSGESGLEILYNQIEKEERISAYEQVPVYGWGAIVQQPTTIAFATLKSYLRLRLISDGITLFIAFFLAYFISFFINIISVYHQKEKIFMDSIGDGVFAIDRFWNITLWNKAAYELTGWSADEVIGKPFRNIIKFIDEATKKENVLFIEEAMLYGEVRPMENHTFLIQKNGQEIPVGDSASPIFDRKGQVNGCIIVFRDVSKDLEVEKVKDDFIFRVVHDLRSPLTVISSILSEEDTIKLFSLDTSAKEAYDLMNSATKKMLKMVNDLLSVAKSKALGTSFKKISISDVIKEAMKALKPIAISKQIIYEYLPPSELPTVAVPNLEHMNEIFNNLFTNAIKYNKQGGRIIITHEIIGGFLKTNISDTGIGIAEKNIDKIFASYTRINEKEGIQGTGLGLYIVKKLIEEAKGKIEVSSKEGEGSTFSVYLPTEI